MKHMRGISKPLPQEAVVLNDLFGFLVNLLLSPVVFLLNLLGKNLVI